MYSNKSEMKLFRMLYIFHSLCLLFAYLSMYSPVNRLTSHIIYIHCYRFVSSSSYYCCCFYYYCFHTQREAHGCLILLNLRASCFLFFSVVSSYYKRIHRSYFISSLATKNIFFSSSTLCVILYVWILLLINYIIYTYILLLLNKWFE